MNRGDTKVVEAHSVAGRGLTSGIPDKEGYYKQEDTQGKVKTGLSIVGGTEDGSSAPGRLHKMWKSHHHLHPRMSLTPPPGQKAGPQASQDPPQEMQFPIILGPKYLNKDVLKLCQNSFSQQTNRPLQEGEIGEINGLVRVFSSL